MDTALTNGDGDRSARPVRATGGWAAWWRAGYRLLRLGSGLFMRLAMGPGFGNVVVLTVPGRRSRRPRRLPLGLLRVGDRAYVGHPSGDASWTLNLRAAGPITLESAWMTETRFRAVLLEPGPERDEVVRATFRQHPFPGNLIYRVAGRHVFTWGVYFRLEAVGAGSASDDPPGS